MKFCEKCGAKLEPNQKFCEACGYRLDSASTDSTEEPKKVTSTPQGHTSNQAQTPPTPALSKRAKIGLSAAAVVLIAGFFGYRHGEEYYSRENQVDRLVEVLESGDSAEIASVLSSGEEDFEIDEESIEPFVTSVLEETDLSQTRRNLRFSGTDGSLQLVQEGSHFFMFDKYELVLLPAYTTITTNMSNVEIFMDGEELVTSDSEDFSYEYGPFIPGSHEFTATTDLNGEELTVEQQAYLYSGTNNSPVNLSVQAYYFTVTSNADDAHVFLNDEEIGQLENGEGYFGPYASLGDSSLHLTYDEEFGEVSTDPVVMYDYDNEIYNINFSEGLSDVDAYEVLDDMYNTLSSLTNTYNVSSVSRTFEEYFNSGTAYDELRPFFTEYAQRQRENEDVSRIDFTVLVRNFERVDYDEYTVELEVDYRTVYSDWDQEDRVRTFTYDVSLVADQAVRNTWNEEEFFINGFSNEELIYDSHE